MWKILLCFALSFQLIPGSSQTYFSKLLETPYPYVGAILGSIETPDSGFILMHTSFDIFEDTNKINIVKINKNGGTIWHKSYGATGTAHEQYEIIRTKDSCYVFCGAEQKDLIYSAMLFKINEQGDSIWMKTFNIGFYLGVFGKVIETSDNGLIAIGGYDKTPPDGSDPWRQAYIVKTDKDGNLQWQRSYGSAELNDNGRDIVETPEGDFICSGYVGYPYLTNDFYVRAQVMKINAQGQIIWIKEYPVREYNQAFIEINRTLDGNYLVSGDYTYNRYATTGDPNHSGGILLKIDSNGNTLWFKRYQEEVLEAGFYDYVELPDSSIVTIGFSYFPDENSTLVKFSSTGEIKWKNIYKYNTAWEVSEGLFKVIHTKDNGFLMCGYGVSPILNDPFATSKGWILKVDSLGCAIPLCVVATDEPDQEENNSIEIYPNPFLSGFQIELPVEGKYKRINVYDVTGHLLFVKDLEIGDTTASIDGSRLNNGVFFVEILSKTERVVKKIIKIE